MAHLQSKNIMLFQNATRVYKKRIDWVLTDPWATLCSLKEKWKSGEEVMDCEITSLLSPSALLGHGKWPSRDQTCPRQTQTSHLMEKHPSLKQSFSSNLGRWESPYFWAHLKTSIESLLATDGVLQKVSPPPHTHIQTQTYLLNQNM